MTSSTDRIEKSMLLKAPVARVWNALTNAEEFGNWFGAKLKGQSFAVGQRVLGPISICGFEHVMFDVIVERMEPQTVFSFHWHPYAVDPAIDYAKETPTLVEFKLKEAEGGTLLNVVESGFDKIPPSRRDLAFRMNNGGWDGQLRNIEKYVTTA